MLLFPNAFPPKISRLLCGFAILAHGVYASALDMSSNPDVQAFIANMVDLHQMDAGGLTRLFRGREPNATVLKLVAPPASPSQRSWRRYRARFLDPIRIQRGVEFWQKNAAALQRAHQRYGVPEEIIVAIIGVETIYGRDTGSFNTLEALATLAFYYPPRAYFFRQELEQFLLLARENRLPPENYRSSYAGALGIPQFMPGSQRRYAVDFDSDGRVDLQESATDAIGSVAHFLSRHGWQPNAPVAVPADLDRDPDPAWLAAGIRPTLSVNSLLTAGVHADADPESKVTFVDLVTPGEKTEYWLGHENFYVITRYNRSSFYAMSVYQLAREIRKRKTANGKGRQGRVQ
ncbi:MAG: lytic murein transglycosylase B [Zoogloeaceae bacterium]|nr:lytic murein transglycosylase B [Zoogloeaceae bacterium]